MPASGSASIRWTRRTSGAAAEPVRTTCCRLTEDTLWVADEVSVDAGADPRPGRRPRLARPRDRAHARGWGATSSRTRSSIRSTSASRRRSCATPNCATAFPTSPIMMGIGNLTELTEADTTGINALLMGIASELRVNAVLATEVSLHARTAVREADLARRIMFAARDESSLPKGYDRGLTTTHERKPRSPTARTRSRPGAGDQGSELSHPGVDAEGSISTTATGSSPVPTPSSSIRSCKCRRRRGPRVLPRRRARACPDRLAARQALQPG